VVVDRGDVRSPSRKEPDVRLVRTPASRVEHALATAVSVFVWLLIFFLTSIVAGIVQLAVQPDPEASPAAAREAVWISTAAMGVCYVVAWLAVSEGGKRMTGDAVMSLECVEASGAAAPRWRVLLRSGLPIALLFLSVLVWQEAVAVPLVVLLWAPALLGPRRSVFDWAAGVRMVSYKRALSPTNGFRWKNAGQADSNAGQT
jgi:hypothetical protein